MRLDRLPADFQAAAVAGRWLEVMDRLNLGEMPPADSPRPDLEEQRKVTGWIAAELRHAARRAAGSGGRVLMRRLNRVEYANTIRDLLSLEFLPGKGPLALLPPDGTAEGFDTVSQALTLDPSLLDKYFQVARQVAERAIVDGPPEFRTEKMRFEFESIATNRAIDYLCAKPGFICRDSDIVLIEGATRSWDFRHPQARGNNQPMPVEGLYRIRIRASAQPGADGRPVVMRVRQQHPDKSKEEILEVTVAARPDAPEVYSVTLPRDALGKEIHVSQAADVKFYTYNRQRGDVEREIREAGRQREYAKVLRLQGRLLLEGLGSSRPNPETVDRTRLPRLYLDWLEVEGPLYGEWPPRSHRTLLFRGEGAERDLEYVTEIFRRFLPRAWRRPVSEEEVGPIVRLVEAELQQETAFEEALRVGLTAALTSPHFLYRVEPASSGPRPLNDYELASRLSYFLWSSMPDSTLYELAHKGTLNQPEVLEAQVDRMLADPKSEALVRNFARQWLRTDTYRNFMPDPKLYPEYDESLGEAMVGESLAFFREILRHDLSVLSFLDSDWSMLNERLARFYGIEGVEGKQFRRVPFPDDIQRGGLLTQAGVLMAGSDGVRTKPVSRGVYVREVLFNDPPDPPPANVGEIEPNIEGRNLTVRQRLLQHQQIETCAACHRTIDPYGLALENYNVIGRWRNQQDGEDFRGRERPAIDAGGRLPNGESFDNVRQFKALLMKQQDRFRRALTERMMVYALGRPIDPADRETVEMLTTRLRSDGDTLRTLIQGLVASPPFRTK